MERGTSGNLGWKSLTSRGEITVEKGRMGQALQKLLAGHIRDVYPDNYGISELPDNAKGQPGSIKLPASCRILLQVQIQVSPEMLF